jgi:BirA family transcriptional regulator, biotin operon repressor / biotin---[acetyl-CoA-carboxylase] ligase
VFSNPPDSAMLNILLLERLRRACGQFVSLVDLGSDRTRVWDDLDALKRFGFQIERHPYLGAAYRGPACRLCPDQIEHGLQTRSIGRRIAVWNRVGSTNDLAARAAATMANDGLVVLAEEQTAGRGQRGRLWTVPLRSSILMSVLLFPPADLTPLGLEPPAGSAWLTALAAVATAELVSDWTGRHARIKWPNDVRVDGRKISGILVERALAPASASLARPDGDASPRHRGVVIGIGLNVNVDQESFPSDLRRRVTSLGILTGGEPIDRSELARDLIRRLDTWYEQILTMGPGVLNDSWRERSEHLGNLVRVVTPGDQLRGRLVDLDLHRGLTLDLGAESQIGPEIDSPGTTEIQPRLRQVALGNVLALEE